MKTLLVLAEQPGFAAAIRELLNPAEYHVVHRRDVAEAEPLLHQGLLDACIIDVELDHARALWTIENVRRWLPHAPLIVFTGARQWEWEEEAYLQGVSHILNKPPRGRTLHALLERLAAAPTPAPLPPPSAPLPAPLELSPVAGEPGAIRHLETLRDFSAVLAHSLNPEALLHHFLRLVREILGVNRAAIFLRPPVSGFEHAPAPAGGRRLRAASALGLSHALLENVGLSIDAGIGGYLFRHGRILRRDSSVAFQAPEIQKEFDLLGLQVAIPIYDRESLIGVAAFDYRLTGEPLGAAELRLIFHLLEELGLAIKNIWLHHQLAANHGMMADILRELSSACVLVDRDLTILHANQQARDCFFSRSSPTGKMEFSQLPTILASKVYQVLQTGDGIAPFKHHPAGSPGAEWQVSIVPFHKQDASLPSAALLVVDDHTLVAQVQRLEIEAANLRLVKAMADRMAHEIGNALVPLATHQQLLADKFRDPEFRASLDVALADGVKRISRLTAQMRFLARDNLFTKEAIPLKQVVEEAFQEALKQQPTRSAKLKLDEGDQAVILNGDRAALRHALAEIVLNAIQANPTEARVTIRLSTETDNAGARWAHVEIQDTGAGFTPEAAQKATQAFFTTRNVGLGLGLTVARKIVEAHQGQLTIPLPVAGHFGLVKISLPLNSTPRS